MVTIHLHRVLGLILALLLLVACTRDRPQPEPVITTPPQDASGDSASGAQEPEVMTAATASLDVGAPTSATDADAAGGAANSSGDAASTPGPNSDGSLVPYTVQSGDTITSIATKFGTTAEEIRRINFLANDDILVGQVLRIALGEGYLPEGGLPTPTPAPYTYTVQGGDTLNAIALRFGIEVAAIIDANRLIDANNLVVGQQLVIPGYQSETPIVDAQTGTTQAVHVVQRGDTLLSIAAQYGVSVADIAAANNIQNRNILRIGQQLFIPGISAVEAARTNQLIHVVQPGESLLAIAVRYGVTTEELAALNQIQDIDIIQPGQELIIPQE